MLERFIPGFKVWAMGYATGIGASEATRSVYFDNRNWLFAEYAPSLFTAQIRFGLDAKADSRKLYIKPSIYFNLLDDFIKVGTSFEYTKNFYDVANTYKDTWFTNIELKPLVQFNFSPNIYAALEYSFLQAYQSYYGSTYQERGLEPVTQTQWFNLRVGVSF